MCYQPRPSTARNFTVPYTYRTSSESNCQQMLLANSKSQKENGNGNICILCLNFRTNQEDPHEFTYPNNVMLLS